MAWKDLDSDLAELFGQDIWREQLKEVVGSRLWNYERIKRYLKTPKGRAALKRYQSQAHVLEKRRASNATYREKNKERERQRLKDYRARRKAAKVISTRVSGT